MEASKALCFAGLPTLSPQATQAAGDSFALCHSSAPSGGTQSVPDSMETTPVNNFQETGILADNNTEATSLTCTAAGSLVCNIFIMCQGWCNFSTVQYIWIGDCLAGSFSL